MEFEKIKVINPVVEMDGKCSNSQLAQIYDYDYGFLVTLID